jgi:hypothetical protein
MSFRLGFSMAAFGFVCVAACGGKVIWTPDGDGGSSATMSSSQKGPSTGIGTSSTGAGSSSSGALSVCEQLCAIPGCQNLMPPCAGACAAMFVPGCESQAQAYVACAVTHVDPELCALSSDDCQQESFEYHACVDPPTGCGSDQQCEGSPSSCECYGTCFGSAISASCKPGPSGIVCECAMNGSTIGTCTGSTDFNCDLQAGCCTQFFNGVDDGPPP